MNLGRRRLVFVGALVAIMPLSGWAGTYDAWRFLLGDDTGTSMALFWDLQVESWANALLVIGLLDLLYRLHRTPDGRWAVAPRGRQARLAAYAGLLVLALVCAAESPVRSVLEVPLPDDIAASVAHYLRRALEGVLATIGILIFLDWVRPGPFATLDRLLVRPDRSERLSPNGT